MEKKIIMFPLPVTGHFQPMIQLAAIFHHRGFSVTILHTSFNSPDPSHYPLFTFRTVPHNNKGGEDPMTRPEASSLSFIALLRQTYVETFRQSLAAEVGGGGEKVCCLVSDVYWGSNTVAAAEELGVRTMVFLTSGAASFCASEALPVLIRDKRYIPVQDSRLEEPVTELPPLKMKDLPIAKNIKPEELYQVSYDMVKKAKSSSGLIWNTFEDLERPSLMDLSSKFQIPNFPIGPIYKHSHNLQLTTTNDTEDNVITDWLDKQEPKSVIYVSFGSLADIEEKEFLEIAWGLRNSEVSFLWVVRPGLVRGTECLEALPSGFMEDIGQKGKFVKWVNQKEVLAHSAVGAFWTHCGWNSTLESICAGVPMICTACFIDQFVNARYIVDVWRIGVELERRKMDRKEIEKVLRSIVTNEGDEIKEMCLKWKERADVCLTEDGSSSKYLDKLVDHVLSF